MKWRYNRMSETRVAVVLSGSGVKDGSEIHEAVSAMIALDRAGYRMVLTAPDIDQTSSIDHLTDEDLPEKRNVLRESARIARGDIVPLAELSDGDYDAVLFPGGFGAARNLCSFAVDGPECTVLPEVEGLIRRASSSGKPVVAMCIAPVLLARCIGDGVKVTIGNDPGTAAAIEKMGGVHVECEVDAAVIDRERRVVTTPAYMLAEGPAQVFRGAEAMVSALGELLSP